MARVRIAAAMPYALVLPDGEYDVPPAGPLSLRLALFPEGDGVTVRTRAYSCFEAPSDLDAQAAERMADRQAGDLLARANRPLRWYRLLAAQPNVRELTLGAMSPFSFALADSG